MNTMKPNLLIFLLLCCLTFGAYAQDVSTEEEDTTAPADATLNEQFNRLKESSNTYNNFKIIREAKLNAFWTGVTDSIAATKNQLQLTQTKVNDLQAEL